ncbi:MAG: hypothetical protein K1X78_01440 [Verrucomicrobiaceae bacterium]|nr:hypothetical protein [Verrucomicrobiaceae bacterium]
MLAPLFASAHGTEFLLGKLTIAPGAMRLELTADCDANPMIADRKEAAEILPGALQIQIGDEAKPLESLAPIRLEDRTKFDESAPLPPGAFDNSIDHQLLTAEWQWEPDRKSVRFAVPKASKHDVLLWVVDTGNPAADPRWMVLLGGDVTPEVMLPVQARGWRIGPAWMLAGIVSTVVLAAGARRGWRSARKARGASADERAVKASG